MSAPCDRCGDLPSPDRDYGEVLESNVRLVLHLKSLHLRIPTPEELRRRYPLDHYEPIRKRGYR